MSVPEPPPSPSSPQKAPGCASGEELQAPSDTVSCQQAKARAEDQQYMEALRRMPREHLETTRFNAMLRAFELWDAGRLPVGSAGFDIAWALGFRPQDENRVPIEYEQGSPGPNPGVGD